MTTSLTSTPPYATSGLEPADVKKGFRSGTHALDDYFARHAIPNDRAGIARTYVLRRAPDAGEELPEILGFYTLSMASIPAAEVTEAVGSKLNGSRRSWTTPVPALPAPSIPRWSGPTGSSAVRSCWSSNRGQSAPGMASS